MQGDRPFPLRTLPNQEPKFGVLDLPDNKFFALVVGMACGTSIILCAMTAWMVSWFV